MAFWRKFSCGGFGTFCLLLFRGIPPVPGLQDHVGYWWVGVILMVSGGFVTHIWDDKHNFRSWFFGLTWPALVAAVTLPPR